MRNAALALDSASARTYDADGRLHVSATPISKANVCEYMGKEIPDYERLGLRPGKPYRLWKPPAELARAARTFNNLPVLDRHVIGDFPLDAAIGATGSDASFAHPHLQNSVAIWACDAVADVRNEHRKELSAAYRYTVDMGPGRTPDGEEYDGIMRNIIGTHVALVRKGRAGPDVGIVGDEAMKSPVFCYERHPLAMALDEASRGAAPSSLQEAVVMAAIRELIVQDASIEQITAFVDTYKGALDERKESEMGYQNPNDRFSDEHEDGPADYHEHTEGFPEGEVATDSGAARLHALLSEHLPPEAMAEVGEILASIAGEAEEGEHEVDDAEGEDSESPTRRAIEARHAKIARANSREDEGAGPTYKTAKHRNELNRQVDAEKRLGQDAAGLESYRRMFSSAPAHDPRSLLANYGQQQRARPRRVSRAMAMDATALDSYSKLFPSAAHIGRV